MVLGQGGHSLKHLLCYCVLVPCRGKPAWKALLGRLAPLAPRGPPGSPGLMACEGSRALW